MHRFVWMLGLVAVLLLTASTTADENIKYHYQIKNFTVNLDHFSFANNQTFQIR